jgi:hypothetical protein
MIRRISISLLFLIFAISPVFASLIQYELTSLGGDFYRYDYTVFNDGSLGAGVAIYNFEILFDPSIYDESSLVIATPNPPASDWDEAIYSSVPGIDAAYDALSLSGGIPDGSYASGFAVEFKWIGGASGLGSQPYEIYDPDTFEPLETEQTSPPIPEPGTFVLLGIGLAALTYRKQRM